MKYATISVAGSVLLNNGSQMANLGDYMQILALENIYQKMGIDIEQCVSLRLDELVTYCGETVILPINHMIANNFFSINGKFIFSENIIPVFLGVCFYRDGFDFTKYNIDYMNRFGPIGCRDYLSLKLAKQHGVNAYMAGCITVTLPRREIKENYNTAYFVDTPQLLDDYIPRGLFENCKFVHHIRSFEKELVNSDEAYIKKLTYKLLEEYRDNAKLVITSRLHCAAPCIAMGIPVILVREYYGYTFEWFEQYIPIYTSEQYASINWNPHPIEYEEVKEKIIENAIYQIRMAENNYNHARQMSKIYPNKSNISYSKCQCNDLTLFKRSLKNKYQPDCNFKYAIWGITEQSKEIYEFISLEFVNAKLVEVFDTYRKIEFMGIKSKTPDEITKHSEYIVIVTSVNAVNAAKEYFDKIGKDKKEYLFISSTFMDDIPIK